MLTESNKPPYGTLFHNFKTLVKAITTASLDLMRLSISARKDKLIDFNQTVCAKTWLEGRTLINALHLILVMHYPFPLLDQFHFIDTYFILQLSYIFVSSGKIHSKVNTVNLDCFNHRKGFVYCKKPYCAKKWKIKAFRIFQSDIDQ